MDIRYEMNPKPLPPSEKVLALFEKTGLLRPNWSVERMDRALRNGSVVACAWHLDELVGFARAISDFTWIGYLSQLAVAPNFQRQGIGKQLVTNVLQQLGEGVSLLVHSADNAIEFYDAVGFKPYSNVYIIPRKK
jgi:ribosomal protein S18 acetylase RimI-like enzyme